MHVAFAMTGNRVEKTLRKAGLRKFIGDQWFFPTVEVPMWPIPLFSGAAWGDISTSLAWEVSSFQVIVSNQAWDDWLR
jgi:hypothetical protein